MKTWDEISDDAKEAMSVLGDASPTVRVQDRMVKGYMNDGKAYFDSMELRRIAAGLDEVAKWLDERATLTADAGAKP